MAAYRVYVTRTEVDRGYFVVDADSAEDAIAAAEEEYETIGTDGFRSTDVLSGSGIDWSSAVVNED